MSNSSTKIRVVVPAFRSTVLLKETIKSIKNGLVNFPNSEIVVVDNGENPVLSELLNDYGVIIVKADEKPSAAFARNSGAAGFVAGILVFIDSDVIINQDCIEKLVVPVDNKKADATIGNYSIEVKGLSFTQKYKQLYIHNVYNSVNNQIKNDFWTAICAIDSKVFYDLNGFDSSFSGANGEDQEFGIRLSQKGKVVQMVPDARGTHWHSYSLPGLIKNDLLKGIRALKNGHAYNVPLSDNRHANKKARVSVFIAGLIGLFAFISIFFPIIVALVALLGIFWISLKSDLYSLYFKSQGFFFLIKSILLSLLLEYVRITAVFIFYLTLINKKIGIQVLNTNYASEYE